MRFTEPIKDKDKILAIKDLLLREDSPRNYLLFTFGVNSALRIGDLLSLRVKDILNGKGGFREELEIKLQKTRKNISIYLNDPIKKALTLYFDKGQAIDPNDFLFYSFRRGGFRDKAISRVRAFKLIKKWTKAVGLDPEKYSCHSLRKTWGYFARKQGANIELISEMLGHRNSNITRKYLGITKEELRELIKKIEI
ncbi:Tyrosine recombinase XerC [subsurface metagenome]